MDIEPNTLRYLDLIENVLTFALWRDPPTRIETFNYNRRWYKRIIAEAARRCAACAGLTLCVDTPRDQIAIEDGLQWPILAHTMIGKKRLRNLRNCLTTALRDGVPGDFIETGVWRGGACILARAVFLALNGGDRKVFVADSFAGLPPPEQGRFARPVDVGDRHHQQDFLRVSQEEVIENFRKYDLFDDNVVFLKGWFKDTLPAGPFGQFAVIRLDGDMYSSTMDAMQALYPRLSPGGFCIIDDYALKGCREAVDDYRKEHGIIEPLENVDWSGVFWRKAVA